MLFFRALVALLLAAPTLMGPYFARTYFEGDYSISQRLALLTAIGLGTRELAGFDDFAQEGYIHGVEKMVLVYRVACVALTT